MRKERASVANPLTITELPPCGIATIMNRKDIAREAIGAAIGVHPPAGPSRVEGEHLALIGSGPGTWLAFAEAPGPTWPMPLAEQLAGLASVSDQSGSYTIFRIVGADARKLLQAGASIDLHPDAFRPGSVATTVIAHIGVIIWQLDDAPTFEIATFRSYAHSFRRWLDVTAAAL
jgi:heterotetrameric sarcosine oxidase gamma subunit